MTSSDDTLCISRTQENTPENHSAGNRSEFFKIINDIQRRIGQDLHDGVEQEIVGLGLISEALLKKLMCENGSASEESIRFYREMAKTLLEGIARTHVELQSISRGLVATNGFHTNLTEALESLANRTDLIQGITCSFCCAGAPPSVPTPIALQLYRIAQESVCNAIKHSGASRILIAIEVSDGETKLKIADNGNGFHDEHTHVGLGIQSMQYRAELIGANLQISTSTSGGTVVCCAIDESKDE